jgi:glutamate-5-semialdehyde dehydrogenase
MYLHSDVDKMMAVDVVLDSKCDYPAACNSLETLLVHEDVLGTVLPAVAASLIGKGVVLRCDQQSRSALERHLPKDSALLLQDATDADYLTEFLDLILAIRTITPTPENQLGAVDAAIEHVNTHGSHHTDAILTSSKEIADHFCNGIDSACKFWNCSTRFCDGMRFGFGTEVGISTNKVHARGPVGLEGLMIHEYRLSGTGQGAAMYGVGGRQYTHKKLPV